MPPNCFLTRFYPKTCYSQPTYFILHGSPAKPRIPMKIFFMAFLLLAGSATGYLSAQLTTISYAEKNTVYHQSFDALSNSGTINLTGKGPHHLAAPPLLFNGLDGWNIWLSGGTGSNANFLNSAGTATTGSTYSFGSVGSTERALGTLATGSGVYAIGVIFTNNTGTDLTEFSGSFVAEQWRKAGSGNTNKWTGKYATGSIAQINHSPVTAVSQLNFSTIQGSTGVSSLNGNLPINQQLIQFHINNIHWKNGEQLLLRWDDTDEPGSDDAMAIDDFSFSASSNAAPTTQISNLYSLANNPTNSDTIQYAVQFEGNISGLSTANFVLKTNGISHASITKIEGSGNAYTASIFTGIGNGLITLGIENDANIIPGLAGLPFYALDSQMIDKEGPIIQSVSIPNQWMKRGDTISVTIRIRGEAILCKMLSGNIAGFPLQLLSKLNDSTYSSQFILPSNGNNIKASGNIPVSLILLDTLQNQSLDFSTPIEQDRDGIYFQSVLWTGNINNSWLEPLNWNTKQLPSDTSDVIIPATAINMPLIQQNINLSKLTIDSLAKLTITGTLHISESILADTGSIDASDGSIVLTGDSPQQLNGKVFKKQQIKALLINNSSSVSLESPLFITKSLGILKTIFQTNNQLYMLHNAVVEQLPNGSSISGKIYIEHKLNQRKIGNYLVAHPFKEGVSLGSWIAKPITDSLSNFPATDSFNIEQNWLGMDWNNILLNNVWKKNQAIRWNISPNSNSDNSIADSSNYLCGAINTGLQEIKLTQTSKGFNIIANPFLSPVNIQNFSKGIGVGNYFWVWNPQQGLNGGYTSLSADADYILNPFQGFIAFSKQPIQNELFIPELSKTNQWNNDSIPSYQNTHHFHVEIGVYGNGKFWDQWVLASIPASSSMSDTLDAIKLKNPGLNFYSLSTDKHKLSIDARQLLPNTVIPLRLELTGNGSFFFKVQQAFLAGNNELVLHDRFTNQFLPLKKDSIMAFNISSDSLSIAPNRFEISTHIPQGNLSQLYSSLFIKIFPNPSRDILTVGFKASIAGNTQIQVIAATGNIVKNISVGIQQSGSIRMPISDLPAGIYTVTVISNQLQKSIQFIKQ